MINRLAIENGVSVIVPNWNGMNLLAKYLPSVFDALKNIDLPSEIIIIDDGSTDESTRFIKDNYNSVKLLENDSNKGFSFTCNKGITSAKYLWVLILNNDVKLTSDYIKILLSKTDISDLFSVSGCICAMGTETIIDGGKVGEFLGGNYRVTKNYMVDEIKSSDRILYSFYNPATCCLYNREKLLALNGFDEMFNPFYWEDTDICYRAWKRGWMSIFEPNARAYHLPGTTIMSTVKKKQVYIISRRNKFIFHWKNLTDRVIIMKNTISLLIASCTRWLILDFKFYAALVSALRKLPEIFEKRRVENEQRQLTDLEVRKSIESTLESTSVHYF